MPAVRIGDLFVRPDWKTGRILVQATIRNAGPGPVNGQLLLTVAPAASGETQVASRQEQRFKVGETLIETTLQVVQHRLWNLDDPFLYRVTARVSTDPTGSAADPDRFHEQSVRCGFRDFRFDHGAFRLNGKRIYLRCSHTGNCCPIGLEMPHDPDYLRRDLINQKMMRFNTIRFISGVPKRYQLDLADEIGLMVYEESYAAWMLGDSPRMKERYNESVFGMIHRDRNHPSVTMWGLLNETSDGPVFRHAVGILPEVRKLDDTRVVMLNSGRFDNVSGIAGIQAWHDVDRPDPCVTRNSTEHVVKALGITWQPGQVAFHPGSHGEYAVVRWTAPADEKVKFSAVFSSIAEAATTDLHVVHKGRPLFDGVLNLDGKGPEAKFSAAIEVKSGDTIDSVCGWGNRNYGADTTALKLVVVASSGNTWDIERDFSSVQNPAGAWSFGTLKPGDKPDCGTFARFTGNVSTTSIGSISNPGTLVWQDILSDQHPYQRVPHTASVLHTLRTLHGNGNPVWLSEYGIGSAMDLLRIVRWYEQVGKTDVEDARLYQSWRDQFLADWKSYRLDQVFDRPEDFFAQSIARMGSQRLLGLNAIRSNPSVVGHSLTGTLDQGMTAEGVWTTFRELKPGATDAIFDGWAPLRWCLFAEPPNLYRGTPIRLEAVLANEDVLAPGEYPVRLQVVGPNLARVFEKTITVKIADPAGKPEPPMVLPVFAQDVVIDGPPGTYRFLATFEKGAAACGEEIKFCVDVPSSEMPPVDGEILLVGADAEVARWLTTHGIRNRPFLAGQPQTGRDVILASGKLTGDPAMVFTDLARRIARGSTAIFLTTETFARGRESTGWLPLKTKGRRERDRALALPLRRMGQATPDFRGIARGRTARLRPVPRPDPRPGLHGDRTGSRARRRRDQCVVGLSVRPDRGGLPFRRGSFLLNSLRIRENLGKVPQAERLIRNMLRFAAENKAKPLADLPADFASRLKAVGY